MILFKKKDMNMTEGSLLGKIVTFFIPLMIANLLQVFYNAADMMVVSLSSEADAVGAIGTTTALINLIVNIFVGFATGATVVVARHLGARENKEASKAVHTALLMSVIFGVGSALIGFLFTRPVLALMGVEGRLLELATLYTRIYFAGVPFVSITNYAAAIMRAKGDTATPLAVLSISGLLNVLLNLAFVLILDMSVDGVALATVLSNAVSAILLIGKMMRYEDACRFSFRRLCLDRKAFGEILYIGLPTGIQSSLFSVSNILIQSSILQLNNMMSPVDSMFQPVVKGNSAAQNLAGFGFTSINAVTQAAITFTGQNIGAKKPERVRRVLWYCLGIVTVLSLLISFGIYLLREPLFALYGVIKGTEDSLEQIAFETAMIRTQYILLPMFTAGCMEISCGVAKGLGRAMTSTFITLVGTCALRVVWIYTVFRWNPTLETLYICYPITWVLTGFVQFIFVFVPLQKIIKRNRTELLL